MRFFISDWEYQLLTRRLSLILEMMHTKMRFIPGRMCLILSQSSYSLHIEESLQGI
jgi:hypothetical protein